MRGGPSSPTPPPHPGGQTLRQPGYPASGRSTVSISVRSSAGVVARLWLSKRRSERDNMPWPRDVLPRLVPCGKMALSSLWGAVWIGHFHRGYESGREGKRRRVCRGYRNDQSAVIARDVHSCDQSVRALVCSRSEPWCWASRGLQDGEVCVCCGHKRVYIGMSIYNKGREATKASHSHQLFIQQIPYQSSPSFPSLQSPPQMACSQRVSVRRN